MSEKLPLLGLDIDGVLNSNDYRRANPRMPPWDEEQDLDPAACRRLEIVLRLTGAKILLTSAWRILHTIGEMQRMLRARGCPSARLVGMTPNLNYVENRRGHEIAAWLKDSHDDYHLALVDDSDDMGTYLPRLVRTENERGFSDEHIAPLVQMLTPGPLCPMTLAANIRCLGMVA